MTVRAQKVRNAIDSTGMLFDKMLEMRVRDWRGCCLCRGRRCDCRRGVATVVVIVAIAVVVAVVVVVVIVAVVLVAVVISFVIAF